MSLRINLNAAAQLSHRVLAQNDSNLSKSIERLSTGYKINQAADSPAGLAISESLRAQISGLNQAVSNTQDAVNMVKTAEGALTEVHNLLRSMRTLAVHALNTGAVDSTQAAADQAQITSAIDALNRISSTTAFGGRKLLDGTAGVQGSITSGTGATFLTGNENTVAGNYTVTVNTAASQATYQGSNAATAATVTGTGDLSVAFAGGDAGNLVFELGNGSLVTVALAAADTLASVQTKIDTAFAAVAAPYKIDAGASGNNLTLTNTTAGAENNVKISANSTAATLTKLGMAAGTTEGTGNFDAQSTAGTLTINGVNINVAANDTSSALVARINLASEQTGVTASKDDAGQITLKANAFGSASNIVVSASGGYTLNNIFGAAAAVTQGSDVNATVARTGGQTVTSSGTGQIWTGTSGSDTDGMQLKITATGAKTVTVSNGSLQFQVGAEVGQTASVAVNGTNASTLGKTTTAVLNTGANSLADINVTTSQGAADALHLIDAAIQEVSTMRSSLGAAQTNVFESAINSLGVAVENISASESAIRDTDMASEISNFTKYQVLSQSTVSMLAQANQTPQTLLKLLQ